MLNSICSNYEIGNVRVQSLGPYLVRIEQRGPRGFEDRPTFAVAERPDGVPAERNIQADGTTVIATVHYRVVVPASPIGLEGIRVQSGSGVTHCVLSNAFLARTFLPTPSALPAVWVLGDSPRMVPPAWGGLPPPAGETDPDSGWDLQNDAPDIYVFLPRASGYETFRADFLRLTGGIPLVPLYALGLWYSRYFPYSEETALAVIDRFRQEGIPLDVFVADTDWRVGASCGYAINGKLFPDLPRFLQSAHARHVRVMFNDHPEPHGASALAPEELRFRRDGLVSLLALGADLWWFDRNWHTHLQAPAPGLNKEVWGMRLYHDITQDFRPAQRPLIMSNVDGINNGRLDAPSHPAAHRFPVWWTGDTCAEWNALRLGVANGVNSGLVSLLPYVHEDLGGHHGQPDPELYVRFMQYGAFSPVARIHCAASVHRYPWEYGPEVARIVGGVFRLRYRLLPMLYAAAFDAHRTGTPLLRRCDLEWPDYPEAADATQYLLGDDLLVAPIVEPAGSGGRAERSVWLPPGEWQDIWTGRSHAGPATIGVACALDEYPVFVRRGGIVCTTAQRQWTGCAVWTELVVDAYAPRADGARSRLFYEDDGISTAYNSGAGALTTLTLRRAGANLEFILAPDTAPAGIRPSTRNLTLRLHLPPGISGSGDEFAVLPPAEARLNELFAGAGVCPPRESGPVLEWRGTVATAAVKTWTVQLEACGTLGGR